MEEPNPRGFGMSVGGAPGFGDLPPLKLPGQRMLCNRPSAPGAECAELRLASQGGGRPGPESQPARVTSREREHEPDRCGTWSAVRPSGQRAGCSRRSVLVSNSQQLLTAPEHMFLLKSPVDHDNGTERGLWAAERSMSHAEGRVLTTRTSP